MSGSLYDPDATAELRVRLRELYDSASLACSRISSDDRDSNLIDFYEGKREAFGQALAALDEALLAPFAAGQPKENE